MRSLLQIAASSYLLGSIPFGYLLVRFFLGEDVRQTGSGNIGATNVSRKSPTLGVLTLLLDALKGSAAVMLAVFLCGQGPATPPYRAMSFAALFAVLGHMFPVWLKFRGGKGVATGLGAFAVIVPKAVLTSATIFVAVLLVFRYVSLASIVATAALPIVAWILRAYGRSWMALVFTSLASLLIVMKHHENIRRLLAGTESRIGSGRA